MYYLIISRSLTYAQRMAKVLAHAGITAVVMRVPSGIQTAGCGYCVKVSEKRLSDALVVLNQAGVEYSRIYVLYSDGSSSEVRP